MAFVDGDEGFGKKRGGGVHWGAAGEGSACLENQCEHGVNRHHRGKSGGFCWCFSCTLGRMTRMVRATRFSPKRRSYVEDCPAENLPCCTSVASAAGRSNHGGSGPAPPGRGRCLGLGPRRRRCRGLGGLTALRRFGELRSRSRAKAAGSWGLYLCHVSLGVTSASSWRSPRAWCWLRQTVPQQVPQLARCFFGGGLALAPGVPAALCRVRRPRGSGHCSSCPVATGSGGAGPSRDGVWGALAAGARCAGRAGLGTALPGRLHLGRICLSSRRGRCSRRSLSKGRGVLRQQTSALADCCC